MPRGGKRPGAGRKPDPLKDLNLGAAIAGEILDDLEYRQEILKNYAECGDARLRQHILFRLMEWRFGRPTEAVEVKGDVNLNLTAQRERVREIFARLAGKP